MFAIKHLQDLRKQTYCLEIENSQESTFARIYLDQGASLQELNLGGNTIIQDLHPLKYSDTFASSILFPFANRVKDGVFLYQGKEYHLKKNQKEEQNALHGLVYNKTFNVVSQAATKDKAIVALLYEEKKESIGFPFIYTIQLTYELTRDSLSLSIKVKNTSEKSFPFTVGWHPYFISENLSESSVSFESTNKIIIGPRNITAGSKLIENVKTIRIENKQFDDCWELDSSKVLFNTPKYQLEFGATGSNNYLQIYTPPRADTIAIEPTTGVSNSLNNNIGLQELNAGQTYDIKWFLNLKQPE